MKNLFFILLSFFVFSANAQWKLEHTHTKWIQSDGRDHYYRLDDSNYLHSSRYGKQMHFVVNNYGIGLRFININPTYKILIHSFRSDFSSGETFYESNDSGRTWAIIKGFFGYFQYVWVLDEFDWILSGGVIFTGEGNLSRSFDKGINWQKLKLNNDSVPNLVWVKKEEMIWYSDNNYLFLTHVKNRLTDTFLTTPKADKDSFLLDPQLNSIIKYDSNNWSLVYDQYKDIGRIRTYIKSLFYKTEKKGKIWKITEYKLPTAPSNFINNSKDTLFFMSGNIIYITTNNGQSWFPFIKLRDELPIIKMTLFQNNVWVMEKNKEVYSHPLTSNISSIPPLNKTESQIVYPNPINISINQDFLYIKGIEATNYNYRLMNMAGMILKEGNLNDNKIKLENIRPGVYFLYLINEKLNTTTFKIIVL